MNQINAVTLLIANNLIIPSGKITVIDFNLINRRLGKIAKV